MSVSDKVVVITGSTRGIGRTMAEYLARAGAHVVVSGRGAEATKEAEEFIASFGGSVLACPADVRESSQVEALRECALARFGRIDAWVNNAGITEGLVPIDEQAPDDMRDIIETNLLGHLYGARAILPYFRTRGEGILLNLVGRGYRGESSEFMAVYAATKAAIYSLTKSLAEENADVENIRVYALAPGMIDTDMHHQIAISPRMAASEHVRHLAMDAFGNELSHVGEKILDILGEAEDQTGHVFSLIGPGKRMSGAAKMAYWGMTGKLKPKSDA